MILPMIITTIRYTDIWEFPTIRGSNTEPQIVALLLQGRPLKEPPIFRNGQIIPAPQVGAEQGRQSGSSPALGPSAGATAAPEATAGTRNTRPGTVRVIDHHQYHDLGRCCCYHMLSVVNIMNITTMIITILVVVIVGNEKGITIIVICNCDCGASDYHDDSGWGPSLNCYSVWQSTRNKQLLSPRSIQAPHTHLNPNPTYDNPRPTLYAGGLILGSSYEGSYYIWFVLCSGPEVLLQQIADATGAVGVRGVGGGVSSVLKVFQTGLTKQSRCGSTPACNGPDMLYI